MLSPNLLKSKIPMSGGWGEGFVEFDAKSKFAKIQNSYVQWGRGGSSSYSTHTFHNFVWGGLWNLMLSPNLLKSKIPMSSGGGGHLAILHTHSTILFGGGNLAILHTHSTVCVFVCVCHGGGCSGGGGGSSSYSTHTFHCVCVCVCGGGGWGWGGVI